jgi:hypothetical protein
MLNSRAEFKEENQNFLANCIMLSSYPTIDSIMFRRSDLYQVENIRGEIVNLACCVQL